jgi:hypothetical protein
MWRIRNLKSKDKPQPMTKAAMKRHIKTGGQECCPYCKADADRCEMFDYEEPDFVEGGDIEQIVTCLNCGRKWQDVYRLVEVREIYNG